MTIRSLICTAAILLTASACSEDSNEAPSGTGAGGTSSGGGTGASGAASSSGGGTGGTTAGGGNGGAGGSAPQDIASQYPGDIGIESHPAVVWVENFEEGSVGAVVARYDAHKNQPGMLLDSDVPAASSGSASMRMTAGGGTAATDLYKNFGAGYDELFARYYVKYADGVQWHHTGLHMVGYNPPSNWPQGTAGIRPDGDDNFSVGFEPMDDGTNPRLDFYAYWMKMHSHLDNPPDNTNHWGNTVIHQAGLVATHGWQCVEIHIKMNTDLTSTAGAELGLWMDGVSIVQFDEQAPLGYWVADKFCPTNADSPSCTNYPPQPGTQMIPLDLQWRTTADLKINGFWPENYITSGGAGNVWFDDMVLATERVGCIVPAS